MKSLALRGTVVRRHPPGYLVVAFSAAVILYGGVLAGSGLYPFGSKSILMYDMGNQYSVFHAYYQQVLHGRASFFFTWRSDLGMNFFPLFAYYLASPFSLLVAVVPEQYIPEAMVLIILLKVGTGSAAMAAYLRRVSPNGGKRLAAGFAVPYAVSAWTVSYSFNIMWLDALYLLPLLLIAAEELLRRGRLFPLAAICGATALINYYMFGIIVPFLLAYLAIRYMGGTDFVRQTAPFRFALKAGTALATGATIAGVLLIPTANGLINGRTNILGQDPIPVPLPWTTQAARLFGGTFDWFQGSPNLAAGSAILVAASLFPFLRRIPRRERLGFVALGALLMAASQNQFVYLVFHDGERPNAFPFRYGFLVAALWAILGYRAVAELRRTDAVVASRLLWRAAVTWLVVIVVVAHSEKALMTPALAVFAVVGIAAGAIGIAFATGSGARSRRVAARATALLAVILVADTGIAAAQESSAMHYPARGAWNVHPTKDWNEALKYTAPKNGEFFRSDGVYVNFLNGLQRSQNESLRDGNYGQNHFSSLASGQLHDALYDLGFTEHIYRVWAGHTGSTLLTDALFGFRYLVTPGPTAAVPDPLDRADAKLVRSWPTARVYENTATLPIGFLAPDSLPRELSHDDPFKAQEQMFGLPGAFTDPCDPKPDVLGALQDHDAAGDMIFEKMKTAKAVTVTWHCRAAGRQQVYAWANDMPWAGQYPGTGIFHIQRDDSRPIDYPNVYDNGIHDLGTRTDSEYTVTLTTKLGLFTIPPHFIRSLDVARVDARIAELAQHGMYQVTATDGRLSGVIDADHAGTVFTSVPAIQGWSSITVDGKTVTPKVVASSFIGIPVSAGHHRIDMRFRPPGLRMGGLVTALGLLMLYGLRRRDRRVATRSGAPLVVVGPLVTASAGESGNGAVVLAGLERSPEEWADPVVAASTPPEAHDTPVVPAPRATLDTDTEEVDV